MTKTRISSKLISAKELASLAAVSYAAINNYTDMGLLDVVSRKNRLRMYDAGTSKERLGMISKLISEGYTLRAIVKILG